MLLHEEHVNRKVKEPSKINIQSVVKINSFNYTRSKIKKVPRDIQGEMSGKDRASSEKLVSTIGALASL